MSGSADVRMWKWGYAGKLRMALRHWVCTTRNVHFGVHFGRSDVGFRGCADVEMGVCRKAKDGTSTLGVHHSECPLRSALRELEMGVCRKPKGGTSNLGVHHSDIGFGVHFGAKDPSFR